MIGRGGMGGRENKGAHKKNVTGRGIQLPTSRIRKNYNTIGSLLPTIARLMATNPHNNKKKTSSRGAFLSVGKKKKR